MRIPIDLRPLTDTVTTIRDSVALLPEVVKVLKEIEDAVRSMGDEVHRMRKGVDELGVEVTELRSALESRLDNVADHVDSLGPQLEEMSLAMHPFRRATVKLSRRKPNGDEPIEVEAESEPDQISSGENVSQAEASPSE